MRETFAEIMSQRFWDQGGPDLTTVLLCLMLSFVLGQLMAWVYSWSHSGLSYSRTFVQSIVMLTMIATLVMVIIGANIIAAFGLIGALAIIRFRNVLKDTRDTSFIFAALVIGMAVGSRQFALAVLGAVGLSVIMLYLHFTRFGTRERYDAMLSFRVNLGRSEEPAILNVLRRHCRRLALISARQPTEAELSAEYAYQVSLRDPRRNTELIDELERLEGVREVALAVTEEYQEI